MFSVRDALSVLPRKGFDELGEVRLAAGSGVLVENTFDHCFVQNGLCFVEPVLCELTVSVLNGLENAFSRSFATARPITVVESVPLRDTHPLLGGFLVRQRCHLLRHEQRPFYHAERFLGNRRSGTFGKVCYDDASRSGTGSRRRGR